MKTYENYANEDIVFLHLTEEPASIRKRAEAWADQLKIPWPVGYGAESTLQALEIPGVPTTFVIGRDGNVVWHSFHGGSLDQAIRRAL